MSDFVNINDNYVNDKIKEVAGKIYSFDGVFDRTAIENREAGKSYRWFNATDDRMETAKLQGWVTAQSAQSKYNKDGDSEGTQRLGGAQEMILMERDSSITEKHRKYLRDKRGGALLDPEGQEKLPDRTVITTEIGNTRNSKIKRSNIRRGR